MKTGGEQKVHKSSAIKTYNTCQTKSEKHTNVYIHINHVQEKHADIEPLSDYKLYVAQLTLINLNNRLPT